MIPNYIGESLAAVIPSLLGLIQGLGQDLGCKNVTLPQSYDAASNTTTESKSFLVPEKIIPNYSVSTYFLLMFLILCVSTISFTLLNFSKTAKNQRKKETILADSREETAKMNVDILEPSPTSSISASEKMAAQNDKNEKIILLSLIFFLSFICYGLLPALQSYSTLPYGNQVYNLAVKLSTFIKH